MDDTLLDASTNGAHLVAGDASDAEVSRIQHVYREIERRDGAAQWHTTLWRRFAYFLGGVVLVSVAANVVLAFKASRVQAFVQTVQLTDEGQMILVGVPQDLLAYAPTDAHYMDLVAQWTVKRYWKGDDEAMKRTRNDWAWLFRHSCSTASKYLAQDERTEQPFVPTKKRTNVFVTSITKTATPMSYQVLWRERTIDGVAATLKEQAHTTTFTVGRLRPKTLADAMDNRLGLCVTGYDDMPNPLGK